MPERFEAIVVGGGPAGNAAALTLARSGAAVLQIERGEYAGAKNVQGAILYADALEAMIPEFRDEAPVRSGGRVARHARLRSHTQHTVRHRPRGHQVAQPSQRS